MGAYSYMLETQHRGFRFRGQTLEDEAWCNVCLRGVLSVETWQEGFEANNEIFRMERLICQFEKLSTLAHYKRS